MIQLSHRFIITEDCNMSCPHCFNKDVRGKGYIDADILIKYMKKNTAFLYESDFRMMGGEPTLHPRFGEIVEEATKYFGDYIKVYTNGTKLENIASHPEVMRSHFMGKLIYIVNGYTFKPDWKWISKLEKYVKRLSVHLVISLENTDKVIEKAIKCMDMYPYVFPVYSPDSQINIFDDKILDRYRKEWIRAMVAILPEMGKREIPINIDHFFPMCFYTQEMIDELAKHDLEGFHRQKLTCCGELRLGLIDYNFDLYYCNQTRIKIGSLLNDNGEPKPMPEIIEMINERGTGIKVDKIRELSDKCRNCAALPCCKIGCFYNTLEREFGTC